MSPSIISDNTMKGVKTIDNNLFREEIELNDNNIDIIADRIY